MNRKYEELALNAWPALITHQYDGWLIKFANGYTKRANSVYPIYDNTLDYDKKVSFCEAYYEKLGIKPTFKMNDSDMLRLLDTYLEDRGYHVVEPTDLMVMDLTSYISNEDVYEVTDGFDPLWFEAYTDMIGVNGDDESSELACETMTRMLENITQPVFYVKFRNESNKVIAIGYGVVERGNLGIFSIIVSEEHRGYGYGKRVMNAIITEGIKRGATESYLQVICANEVAVNLYKNLGYKKLYTYWYRRK